MAIEFPLLLYDLFSMKKIYFVRIECSFDAFSRDHPTWRIFPFRLRQEKTFALGKQVQSNGQHLHLFLELRKFIFNCFSIFFSFVFFSIDSLYSLELERLVATEYLHGRIFKLQRGEKMLPCTMYIYYANGLVLKIFFSVQF